MGVGGQRHAPAALTPRKTRYPLGGPQGRSERVRRISPPSGYDPWTVQLSALITGPQHILPENSSAFDKV